MTFPRILLSVAAIVMLFSLCAASYGQQPDQERDRMKNPPVTVTGCLDKGENPNEFVLTDSSSGTKMIVTGSPDLEKHAAKHIEKLTGTASEDNKSFTVSKVEHVADSCQAPK